MVHLGGWHGAEFAEVDFNFINGRSTPVNAKLTALAAFLSLACATGSFSQTSSTSGSSAQGSQSQQSASTAAGGQPTPRQQIDQQHKAAMEKCNGMKENAKDICKAEADGQKQIAEAQAKVSERDTPKSRLELEEAKAEAAYKAARERCDDQVGDAKKACQQQAKATRDGAIAQAKMQAQAQGASGSSAAGGSAAGQGTPSGGSISGDSSGGQTMPPGSSASGDSSGAQTMPSGAGTPSGSSAVQGPSQSSEQPKPQQQQ